MGTVSYGYDSMDEIAHQLALAFGSGPEHGMSCNGTPFTSLKPFVGHGRQNSLQTGMQMAARGRRDMSSRVHDVVLSLALCHNVSYRILRAQRCL